MSGVVEKGTHEGSEDVSAKKGGFETSARVIVRNEGSRRLVLNQKLLPHQIPELVSRKQIRLTFIDSVTNETEKSSNNSDAGKEKEAEKEGTTKTPLTRSIILRFPREDEATQIFKDLTKYKNLAKSPLVKNGEEEEAKSPLAKNDKEEEAKSLLVKNEKEEEAKSPLAKKEKEEEAKE
eukprot:g4518.t1